MAKNETANIDIIEKKLKDVGYTTLREVIPIECKNWEKPYRIDLIFYKNPSEAIAVEFKDASLRAGGEIAKAFEQIMKYRWMTYHNVKVIRWCIAPSFSTLKPYENERMETIVVCDFIKYFLNYFDISFALITERGFWLDTNTKNSLRVYDDILKFGGKL